MLITEDVNADSASSVDQNVRTRQIISHYQSIPEMIIAPTVGGLFSMWVLWDAVDRQAMLVGYSLVLVVSFLRGLQYYRFNRASLEDKAKAVWRYSAIIVAFISGSIWGSTAIFLYPSVVPQYQLYLALMLALIPIVPVAGLASYLPAFFAYYVPCASPFIVHLLLLGETGSMMAALLLIIVMGAALAFANTYYRTLYDSFSLQFMVQQQNDTLEQANQAKSIFLASASHDLRQPLHTSNLFIEALQPHLTSPAGEEIHSHLTHSSTILNQLLEGLLDISKLDAGVVVSHKKSFALGPFIQQLCMMCAPLAREKQLKLAGAATSAVVYTDPILLERILRNLIENAIYYTKKGGVLIGCRRKSNGIVVQVVDTGTGIPIKDQRKIFDEFVQLHNQERNRRKGMGLGLAIVKRLSNILDLPVSINSTSQGTIFSLKIQEGVLKRPQAIPNFSVEISPTTLQGKILLAIDDEPTSNQAMTALAKNWGCRVIAHNNYFDAITVLKQQQCYPDILIVDYHLDQNVTGLEAADSIITYLGYALPVVVITGNTSKEPMRVVTEAGHTLLHKPLYPGKLRDTLVRLIG